MMERISHNIHSTQEGDRREHGMRSIEQRHLTLVVGSLRFSYQHIESSLFGRKLLAQGSNRHVGRFLDDPKMEDLGLNH